MCLALISLHNGDVFGFLFLFYALYSFLLLDCNRDSINTCEAQGTQGDFPCALVSIYGHNVQDIGM